MLASLARARALTRASAQVYGVSYVPDVVEYDLCALHALVASPKGVGEPHPVMSVLLVRLPTAFLFCARARG